MVTSNTNFKGPDTIEILFECDGRVTLSKKNQN